MIRNGGTIKGMMETEIGSYRSLLEDFLKTAHKKGLLHKLRATALFV